ncbi:MAG: hypothetical protein QF615_07445 [Planctomycetota bacterium]|nr:hypothetical protein [Planctomycetota bacterium]
MGLPLRVRDYLLQDLRGAGTHLVPVGFPMLNGPRAHPEDVSPGGLRTPHGFPYLPDKLARDLPALLWEHRSGDGRGGGVAPGRLPRWGHRRLRWRHPALPDCDRERLARLVMVQQPAEHRAPGRQPLHALELRDQRIVRAFPKGLDQEDSDLVALVDVLEGLLRHHRWGVLGE